MAMTAAWLEVLDISGVPAEQYESCYAAAVQARAERKANGEQLSHLTADELAAEWIKLRRLHDEIVREEMKGHLLAENAAAACERCFGKEPHVRTCDHRPLTDAEREEQAKVNAAEARKLREQMKQIGSPKPVAREPKPDPPGFWLVCDACGHRYNFMKRQAGDACGYLKNRYLSEGGGDGTPELCTGTMRAE